MRLRLTPLLLLAAALALAAACGGSGVATRTATPSPSPSLSPAASSSPTPTPAPSPTPAPDTGRQVVPAPIDKLDLIVRQSQPPSYAVHILSGLPSGCAQFNDTRIASRGDTTITIEVTNTMPTDPKVACTAIYGTHEEIVELGANFAAGVGQEYIVRVNDKELRFTAQ
jgi:hypothetical protein